VIARRVPAKKYVVAGLALASLGLSSPADAQTSPRGVPADRPDQSAVIPPPARVAPLKVPTPARNPQAAIRPFVLGRVEVAGSTLPPAQIAQVTQPYAGRTIDNPALSAITNALAARYAKSDVALYTVLVPEQRFEGGTLRLAVVEGYVARIEIRGKLRKSRLALLQAYLRRLERERPLRTSTLQRVLSFVRDMSGVTATPRFERGTAQGAVTLVVTVSEKPIQISFGANDRGTALLGRTQVQLDTLVSGLLTGGDQLRATLVLPTHVDRFQYLAGAYTTPLDSDGTSITGNLSYLRTRPSIFPIKGDATSFGVQLTRALIRRYDHNWTATIGIDGIDSNNALFGYTLSNDRIRTLRLASSYTTAGKRNLLTLGATASFGLDIAGARVIPGQSDQRFRKVSGRIADTLQIGKTVVLRLNGFGQATGDRLPSSEQIALGGDEFGRAYEAALITGDTGYAGSAELAWLPLHGLPSAFKGSELYLYTDGGRVTYRSRFGLEAIPAHLASFGGGMRLHVAQRTMVQIEAVRGLSNPVVYEDREKARVLFSIRSLL